MTMATRVQLTIDCEDPQVLADFWATALHYRPDPPPRGFDSWEAWLTDLGVPESEWNDGKSIADPDGLGPRLYFQLVPESKVVKNRLHLDLDIAVPGESLEARRSAVDSEAARLVAAGAAVLNRMSQLAHYHVTMADPEGNEFDLR
jgi:hypothetical protein